jgi:hypothetical protein
MLFLWQRNIFSKHYDRIEIPAGSVRFIKYFDNLVALKRLIMLRWNIRITGAHNNNFRRIFFNEIPLVQRPVQKGGINDIAVRPLGGVTEPCQNNTI